MDQHRANGIGSKLFVVILSGAISMFFGVLMTLSVLGASYSTRIAVTTSIMEQIVQRQERLENKIDLLATKVELTAATAALQLRIDDLRRQIGPGG